MMHIAMHVKSTKMLPTHDVIHSIMQWYLKERHDLSEVPFGPLVIVRLFHRRFLHEPTMINCNTQKYPRIFIIILLNVPGMN